MGGKWRGKKSGQERLDSISGEASAVPLAIRVHYLSQGKTGNRN